MILQILGGQDRSWVALESSWDGLEPLLGALGPLLRNLGSLFGDLGSLSGDLDSVFGCSWGLLARSWVVLGVRESLAREPGGPGSGGPTTPSEIHDLGSHPLCALPTRKRGRDHREVPKAN